MLSNFFCRDFYRDLSDFYHFSGHKNIKEEEKCLKISRYLTIRTQFVVLNYQNLIFASKYIVIFQKICDSGPVKKFTKLNSHKYFSSINVKCYRIPLFKHLKHFIELPIDN